jgi:hypothetical protein
VVLEVLASYLITSIFSKFEAIFIFVLWLYLKTLALSLHVEESFFSG